MIEWTPRELFRMVNNRGRVLLTVYSEDTAYYDYHPRFRPFRRYSYRMPSAGGSMVDATRIRQVIADEKSYSKSARLVASFKVSA